MAIILRKKHDVDNRARTSETTSGPLRSPKFHALWPTNGLKWDRHFYPSSVNSAFYFTARLRTRK